MGRVVVGIDGTAPSGAALGRAVEEAERRAAELVVVAAWSYPPLSSEEQLHTAPTMVEREVRHGTDRQVEAVLGPRSAGAVEIDVRVVRGPPARSLLAAAEGADLLVVGRRDRSVVRHLLLGSVADQCLRHAPCPVLVVPPSEDSGGAPDGPVVVGVDGSADAQRALRWAREEADRSGCELRVVSCWEDPMAGTGEVTDPPPDLAVSEEVLRRHLARQVADAGGPEEVPVELRVERGDPATVLVHHAGSARLLVVGSRGRGGFSRLLLGSVAHHAAHLAPCPVVVLPHQPT